MEKAGPATTMLGEASKYIQDTSVLRHLMFATSVLPEDTPKLWEIITKFAGYKAESSIQLLPQQAKLIISHSQISMLWHLMSRYFESSCSCHLKRESMWALSYYRIGRVVQCVEGNFCYSLTAQVMSSFTLTRMVRFQPFIIENSVLTADEAVMLCNITLRISHQRAYSTSL